MNASLNLLCPIDFSESTHLMVRKASMIAQLMQANLNLVHVIQVLPQTFGVLNQQDEHSQEVIAKAKEQARILMRDIKKAHIPYAVESKSYVRTGSWDEAVLSVAHETNTDYLLLPSMQDATHNELTRISQMAPCPVITLPENNPRLERNDKAIRRLLVIADKGNATQGLSPLVSNVLSVMDSEVFLLTVADRDARTNELDGLRRKLSLQGNQLEKAGIPRVQIQVMVGELTDERLNQVIEEINCDMIVHNHQPNLVEDDLPPTTPVSLNEQRNQNNEGLGF